MLLQGAHTSLHLLTQHNFLEADDIPSFVVSTSEMWLSPDLVTL